MVNRTVPERVIALESFRYRHRYAISSGVGALITPCEWFFGPGWLKRLNPGFEVLADSMPKWLLLVVLLIVGAISGYVWVPLLDVLDWLEGTSSSVREMASYSAPALAAFLLPPAYWRAYLHDVRETFGYRDKSEESYRSLSASFVRSFPRLFVQEWIEAIRSVVSLAFTGLVGAWCWVKGLEGWKAHLFWALMMAVMIEPLLYMVTYVLWLFHREMPWEHYFPMY